MGFSRKPEGARCEGSDSSEVSRCDGALRVRGLVEDPLDEARTASGNLLELPSVLYRPTEADRHGRPRRTLHEEVRRADVREPEGRDEGSHDGEDHEEDYSSRPLSFRSIRATR